MMMMAFLFGGGDGGMETPMMIVENPSLFYPIQGVEDTVPRVCYRSSVKRWMGSNLFADWLNEAKVFRKLLDNLTSFLLVDNWSAHQTTPAARKSVRRTRTKHQFSPKFAANLVQSADSFVIQLVKLRLLERWEAEVMSMVAHKMWLDLQDGSEKLVNHDKKVF